MNHFIILRRYKPDCTRGEMLDENGRHFSWTIERPQDDPEHPCIPEGTYTAVRYNSPTKGNVWMLEDVPGRTYIEIHIANWPHELLGCIALGEGEGIMNGEPAVLGSKSAFQRFMVVTAEEKEITVEVRS